MPLIEPPSYVAPFLFGNGHIQTIYPTLFRKVRGVRYERRRIETPDDDFLDLDWSGAGSERVAIVAHGLEGNSQRSYTLGMVRALNRNDWDAIAWNMRGCSGEPNRKTRFYHSGASEDLHAVIQHVLDNESYVKIGLVGFSLGGNLTLKYLGERGRQVDPAIVGAAVCSVPCDLRSGVSKMAGFAGRIYMIRFLRMLHEKIKAKNRILGERIDDTDYHRIKTFKDFDDRYTAPMHGFRDAEDYWRQASSKQFLTNIAIPTLLVNARNDPFLAEECYPVEEATANPNFYLEMPPSGGHVGFISFNPEGEYGFESRAVSFLNSHGDYNGEARGSRPEA
jgi:predicted alpha/beta-fold hydrolase